MEVIAIDTTSLSVAGHRLDAGQVDQLIHDLAMARNGLLPEVPLDLRKVSGNVVQQHDPEFQVALTPDNTLLFGVRHRGLGWCVFTLRLEAAARLRDFIAKRTGGIEGVGNIDELHAGPHGAH